MIPKAQFTRAVTRFEKAVFRLRIVRRDNIGGKAGALFEFRDARRSLIELGHMLITGEAPETIKLSRLWSRGRAILTEGHAIRDAIYGEPKTGIGAQR